MASKFDKFAQEWKLASLSGKSIAAIGRQYNTSHSTVADQFKRIGYKPAIWNKDDLNDIDASWIAAVLDCEGVLTVHTPWNKTSGNRNIQVFIRVNMVETSVLEKLHRLCAGSLSDVKRNKNPKRKDSYIWNITSNGIRWLLPQIMPYLIIKKRHAEILLAVLGKIRRGGICQMPHEELYPLIAELRSLNQRGFKADLSKIIPTKRSKAAR